MSRRPVTWSEAAIADLADAIAYIAARNIPAARALMSDLSDAGDRLGIAATGRPGRVTDTYEKLVTGRSYIIAYAVDRTPQAGERIVILRVVHTARDWPRGEFPSG